MQDNERKNNGFRHNPENNPHITSDSEKTRLVDISEFTGGVKESADPGKKPGMSGKTVAKITAKSSLFILRKILTYVLNIILTALLVGVITGAVVALAFVIYVKNYIDPNYNGLDNLKFDSSLSTTLWYTNKEGNEVELTNDRLHGSENRLWADYNSIPKNLVNAYVAIEDQRFFEHNGVDTKRTASAIYNFFIPTSNNYGGGSTITQQLIKNVSGENATTIQRKVTEIFRALNVEDKYSKEEILEMYLNTIYLSQNTNGVRAATETYFGKELKDLNLVECASLAAIAKSPVKYDPIINPKNNLQRRNLVLKQMLDQEKISQEEYNAAYDAPLMIAQRKNYEYSDTVHSYYVDTVIKDVVQSLMDNKICSDKTTAYKMLYSGGLQIVTCVDPDTQKILEEVFTNDSYWPKDSGIKAQAAMCIVDPHTGNLIGTVGGRGEKKINLGTDRASPQYPRQCGSAIKPLSVYTLAIDTGLLTYAGPVDDVPVKILEKDGKSEIWPYNAGKPPFIGRVPLTYALKKSLNTVAVATCDKLGVDKVFDNMTEKMGFTTLYKSLNENGIKYTDAQLSPLSLGSFTKGVSVREMTQAYNIIANGGTFVKARSFTEIRDSKGNIIVKNDQQEKEVFKPQSTYIMTSLLFNVIKSGGTAAGSVKFVNSFPGLEVAGKTGSTNDNKDNYFCGYTPDYVGCCWYGYDNHKTITAPGGNPATKLWDAVMNKIYQGLKTKGVQYKKTFDVPADIVKNVTYCYVSGKKPTEACYADPSVSGVPYLTIGSQGGTVCNDGVFTQETVPKAECDMHKLLKYDKNTGGFCLNDGCPAEDIILKSLRNITDRKIQVNTRDSDLLFPPVQGGSGYNKTCPVHSGSSGGDTSGTTSGDNSNGVTDIGN